MAQMTPKEIAVELEVDPKVVRRFLRSLIAADDRPGKGGKWAIDADAMPALRTKFAAWSDRTARTITIADLTDEVDEVDEA